MPQSDARPEVYAVAGELCPMNAASGGRNALVYMRQLVSVAAHRQDGAAVKF